MRGRNIAVSLLIILSASVPFGAIQIKPSIAQEQQQNNDDGYGAGDLLRDILIEAGVDAAKDAWRRRAENQKIADEANYFVEKVGYYSEGHCAQGTPNNVDAYPITGTYIIVPYTEELAKKIAVMCPEEANIPLEIIVEDMKHLAIGFVLGSEEDYREAKKVYTREGYEAYFLKPNYIKHSPSSEWERLAQ